LHGKAAATIHAGCASTLAAIPAPQQLLLDTPDEVAARGAASPATRRALKDLAARTLDGTVPTHAAIRKMTDAEIVERLTQVRGIGPWTVEMLLIFRMGRPDVLPVTDYGVRKGFALTFQRVPKTRPLAAEDCPSPRCCSKGESAGRRSVPWPVGTCGGPAIWPREQRQRGGPAYNNQTAGSTRQEMGNLMAASKRFVCIHGHFYQPPRENPWLETVETQDSAAPYHDWNERICAECYATNGAARIVNSKNQITRIVNNYARISFNFGPTLLSWLKENAPRTYRMILDGERRSRKSFNGHSSAMAQVYNHIILPLASRRDRITQIRWGIADYERHYGAPPEGMWLAETAADNESLELLAQHGIKFTVLAPHQCRRIRPLKTAQGATGPIPPTPRGHHPPLPGPLRLRPLDCRLFLQRPHLAGHRLRGAAELRREPCRAAQGGLQRQLPAATGPCGHRRRVLRPPPQVRRNGAGLRAAPARRGQEPSS
jgi:hypothetical protein